MANTKKSTKVSVELSPEAATELLSFASIPRIVAASLTGPTKEELVKVLTPVVKDA